MTQVDRAGGYSGELTTVVSQDEENDVVIVSTAGSVLVRVRTRTGEPLAGCTLARVMDPAGPTPFLVLRYVGKIDDEGACRIARMRIDAGATIGFVLPDLNRLSLSARPSGPGGRASWRSRFPIGRTQARFDSTAAPPLKMGSPRLRPCSCAQTTPALGLAARWVSEEAAATKVASWDYRAIASVEGIEYDLGLFDVRPGEERVVSFDPRNCDDLPRTSLAEQR